MGCFACENNARVGVLPPREDIYVDDHWRVAHAIGCALRGWLVVVSRRHITTLDEMEEDEASGLGPLLRALTAALRTVTGCAKTYVVLFAEAEGHAHVHFHVVPRMPDVTDAVRGPSVFELLRRPEEEWAAAPEMDRIAIALRDAL